MYFIYNFYFAYYIANLSQLPINSEITAQKLLAS